MAVPARPPPPLTHSTSTYIGWLQNFSFSEFSQKFCEIFNFVFCKIFQKFQIFLKFRKFQNSWSKFCVSQKNLQKLRKREFRSHPTPTQSAVCYSPSSPVY